MKRNENDELDTVIVTKIGDHRDNHNKEGHAVTITDEVKSKYMKKYENYLANAETAASGISGFGGDMMKGFSMFQRVCNEDRTDAYTLIRYSVKLKLYPTSIACIRAAFPAAPGAAIEKFYDAYRKWLERAKAAEEEAEEDEGAEGSQRQFAGGKSDELTEAIELIIRAIKSKKIAAAPLVRLRDAVLSVNVEMKEGSTDNQGDQNNINIKDGKDE